MTDLRTLLHESAPVPRRRLDMRRVRQRAERRGTRRVLTWLAGLGVVVGLAVPAGNALSPASRGDVLRIGGAASTTTSTPGSPGASIDGEDGAPATSSTIGPPDGRAGTVASVGTDVGNEVSASQLDGGAPTPTSTDAEAGARPEGASSSRIAPTDGYPLASACSVDNAHLGPGEQRTCRFTATTKGGAEMRSDGFANAAGNGTEGHVNITRNGTRTTTTVQHNSAKAGDVGVFACGGLIEPGDLVEVVLTNGVGSPDGSTTTLGAGEGWYCWQ